MISFEEALCIIRTQKITPETEFAPLESVLNRILAEEIFSDSDMPPFNKSAMDGFACILTDLPGPLKVIETISAGTIPGKKLNNGQCTKLMTGCMIPQNADCVIKVEETKILDDERIMFTGGQTANNICYLGEDVNKGDRVLEKGTTIKPWHIAILASVGCISPLVYKKLKCGIIATGDELVEPGVPPSKSTIRNSNGWQLQAQCLNAGMAPNYYGIIKDDPDALLKAIHESLDNNPLTLLTGGVSMGDFDFVPAMLKKAGVEILFEKVAVQPGSPTLFGKKGNRFIFGLPGNPVSSLIQFELLVKPLICNIFGVLSKFSFVSLPIAIGYNRKNANRKAFIPVRLLDNNSVMPLEYHGSAHIFAYDKADGLAEIETGIKSVKKGDLVNVRFI